MTKQPATLLRIATGSVDGSIVVKRDQRILAEFFGHEATANAKKFIAYQELPALNVEQSRTVARQALAKLGEGQP